MANIIRTNIKFKKNEEGHFVGFVTKVKDGSWRGVHEDADCKKKIVLVDSMIEDDMIANTLYHCSLIPMTNDNGFIVMNAKIIKFDAKIETVITGGEYRVEVKFGHKNIIYDPTSKRKDHNNMQDIAKLIMERNDLCNSLEVADNFLDAATIVLALYKKEINK